MIEQLSTIRSQTSFLKKLFDSVLTVPAAAREFDKRIGEIQAAVNHLIANYSSAKLRGAKLIPLADLRSIGLGLRNGRWAKSTADLNDPLVRELVDALFRIVNVTEGGQGRRQLSEEQVQQVIDEAYSFATALSEGFDPRLEAARADQAAPQLADLQKALEAGAYVGNAAGGDAFKKMSGEPLVKASEAKAMGASSPGVGVDGCGAGCKIG